MSRKLGGSKLTNPIIDNGLPKILWNFCVVCLNAPISFELRREDVKCRETKFSLVTATRTKSGATSSIRSSNHTCGMVPSSVGQTNRLLRAHNGSQKLSPH